MPTCVYHKDSFVQASAEHILQNALGARWTSDQIVCDPLQAEFGKTIDAAFEEGLRPIRVLLGTRSGRGVEGPTIKGLEMTSGERIDMEPGGRPRLAGPIVDVRPMPDGRKHVHIQAGTKEQIGWALHKLRQQHPEAAARIDPKAVVDQGEAVQRHLPGQARLQLVLGGRDYFRGMLKSCVNLLGAVSPEGALHPSLDPVRQFVMSGEGELADFVRFYPSLDPLPVPSLGQFGHFVGIVTRDGDMEGIVQLFGCVVHPFRLASGYSGPVVKCGYVVDPTRESLPAEVRDPPFEPNVIPLFASQRAQPDAAVWAACAKGTERFLKAIYERADRAMVDEILEEVLGPPDERPITAEVIGSLSQRVAQRFVERHFPPDPGNDI